MKQTVSRHLQELRIRLILVIVFFVIFFFIGTIVSGHVMEKIRSDMIGNLEVSLITLTPFEYLLTRIRIGFFIAVILALPLILYHSLAYLRPALEKKEKRAVEILTFSTLLLFFSGFVFSYLVFLRIGTWFLATLALKHQVLNLWSINSFVTFIFISCFVVGFLFLLPLVMVILAKVGIFSVNKYRMGRKTVIVSIFIFAALITPPDVATQIILSVPLILLYELGILLTRIFVKGKELLG